MSVDIRSSDRRRYMNELQAREKEIAAGLLKASQPSSPKAVQENEKRIRREIANSNERRRMQCINAGFSNLRVLIPQLEGEKLSKAAILQHAAEHITSLEKDNTRLQMQLDHTKGLLLGLGQDRVVADAYVSSSPPPSKRKKRDTESSDEGVCSLSDASDDGGSELQRQNIALRNQMDIERQRCADLEDRNRMLEVRLLNLLHVQASHHDSVNDLHPVNLECHQLQRQNSLYNREMVEVIASRESVSPSPHSDNFLQIRPRSPTPDRGIQRESSVSSDAVTHRSLVIDTSLYSPGEHMSHVQNMDIVTAGDDSLQVLMSRTSSVGHAATTTTILPATDQHSYHHHNYCHRDHPRRRHRQQAQLEQQREVEELRRQQEQHEISVTAPMLYQPKQNTQNLEKLVEAIRQIEGDKGLGKFYEEDHKCFDKHQKIGHAEESERETSSVSDQDELKSESSGRDSPLHHHLHRHHLQRQNIITEHLTSNSSSSYSEKYPISSHLLHRPLHPSYYRPGVIVHKQ